MSISEFGFAVIDPAALNAGIVVAAVSGMTSPSVTGLEVVQTNANTHGNFADVWFTLSFTASASTAVVDITVPAFVTDIFADAAQVQGVANVLTGTGLGNMTALVTTAATRNIRATFALGGSSGTYTVNCAFKIQINQNLTP